MIYENDAIDQRYREVMMAAQSHLANRRATDMAASIWPHNVWRT